MGFFSSLFGGENDTLSQNIGKFGAQGDTATATGEGDVSAASSFYNGILSDDSTKTATALAPQIGAAKERGQQQKKAISEFGTRGGGTGAAVASIDDKINGDITGLVGGLKSSAAGGAASLGTSQEGIGLQAKSEQDQASQQQMQNWMQSIFGGLTGGLAANAGTAITNGLGKIPGLSEFI